MRKKFDVSNSSIGAYGERLAANYLRRRGYTVIERNYRSGHREIDIIARRFRTLAFVEVKTRTYQSKEDFLVLPPPKTAVNAEKIRLTRAAARDYLFTTHRAHLAPRMDVIEISLLPSKSGKKPKVLCIHHIPGAY